VAHVHLAQFLLHEVYIAGRGPGSFPDTPEGPLRSTPRIRARHLVAHGVDDNRGNRRDAKRPKGKGHRTPGTAVHHVAQEDSCCHPERYRGALNAGFHQRPSGILRFVTHELKVTYTLPGKNKKFLI
jgi:hypothetical protein